MADRSGFSRWPARAISWSQVHTSPGAASDTNEVGNLVDWYGDEVAVHLVHFGGGMSGHITFESSTDSTVVNQYPPNKKEYACPS
jgi:hypothetical protein